MESSSQPTPSKTSSTTDQIKPTFAERIRHNLYLLEAIELIVLNMVFMIVLISIGPPSTSDQFKDYLSFVTMMPFVVYFLWGIYLVYIRIARESVLIDILLWVVMAAITASFTFWCWTILDINRFILAKLFYKGNAPVEYAWSHASKQRRKEWEIAQQVAAVQRIADVGDIAALITCLQYRKMPEKIAAATALGKLGDKRAIEPLIAALQHNSMDLSIQSVGPKIPLRVAAATALGELRDVKAVDSLIAALLNKGVAPTVSVFMNPVQAAAATALGQLGDTRAIEPLTTAVQYKPLTPALQRNYEEVRNAAIAALEQLGNK